MKVLVSACLLGVNCKYNGKNNENEKVAAFVKDKEVIRICPELAGGRGIPRACAELRGGVVYDQTGKNVDAEYREGVRRSLEQIAGENIDLAILQSRSPTCGVNQIYDGTFTGTLIAGRGLFAEALIQRKIRVLDAEDL